MNRLDVVLATACDGRRCPWRGEHKRFILMARFALPGESTLTCSLVSYVDFQTVQEAVEGSVEAMLAECHSPGVLRAATVPLVGSKKGTKRAPERRGWGRGTGHHVGQLKKEDAAVALCRGMLAACPKTLT